MKVSQRGRSHGANKGLGGGGGGKLLNEDATDDSDDPPELETVDGGDDPVDDGVC